MRKKVIFVFSISHLLCFSQVVYKYNEKNIINYSFKIEGNFAFSYPGSAEEKFKIFSKGNLKIETIGTEKDFYHLKLIPLKTFIKIGDNVVEDLTNSETEKSSFISSCVVKMKKNGEIVQIEDTTGGLITLKQILKLLPSFPKKMNIGKRWEQKIPGFNIPGLPMCDIKFVYLYEKKNLIKLIGSQIIKEIKKEKDTTIIFNGRNISEGLFNFNEEEGLIDNFNGNFSIELYIRFMVPPSPDIKNKIKETIPIKVNLNLNIQIAKT